MASEFHETIFATLLYRLLHDTDLGRPGLLPVSRAVLCHLVVSRIHVVGTVHDVCVGLSIVMTRVGLLLPIEEGYAMIRI